MSINLLGAPGGPNRHPGHEFRGSFAIEAETPPSKPSSRLKTPGARCG